MNKTKDESEWKESIDLWIRHLPSHKVCLFPTKASRGFVKNNGGDGRVNSSKETKGYQMYAYIPLL